MQTLALPASSPQPPPPPPPPPAAVNMCWTGNDRCAGGGVNDGGVPRAHALHVPDEDRLFLPGEPCIVLQNKSISSVFFGPAVVYVAKNTYLKRRVFMRGGGGGGLVFPSDISERLFRTRSLLPVSATRAKIKNGANIRKTENCYLV